MANMGAPQLDKTGKLGYEAQTDFSTPDPIAPPSVEIGKTPPVFPEIQAETPDDVQKLSASFSDRVRTVLKGILPEKTHQFIDKAIDTVTEYLQKNPRSVREEIRANSFLRVFVALTALSILYSCNLPNEDEESDQIAFDSIALDSPDNYKPKDIGDLGLKFDDPPDAGIDDDTYYYDEDVSGEDGISGPPKVPDPNEYPIPLEDIPEEDLFPNEYQTRLIVDKGNQVWRIAGVADADELLIKISYPQPDDTSIEGAEIDVPVNDTVNRARENMDFIAGRNPHPETEEIHLEITSIIEDEGFSTELTIDPQVINED